MHRWFWRTRQFLNRTPELPFTVLVRKNQLLQPQNDPSFHRAFNSPSQSFYSESLPSSPTPPAQRALPFKVGLPVLDWSTATKFVPLLCVGFVGLVFNTLCLANLFQASLIARRLLLPCTITVSSLATRSTPKKAVVVAAVIITIGFIVGSAESFYPSATNLAPFSTAS
ncbi:hypothetical protein C8F01DRAFT_992335 [Mycena amicta]|nr:hypothetical protein C8F01DRAFT_992335 [Mycena amicta]